MVRRHLHSALLLTLTLTMSPTLEAQADENQIKKLDADLCASPTAAKPDEGLEGGFCAECAKAAASTVPNKIPTDSLTQLEEHELGYLKQKVGAEVESLKLSVKNKESEIVSLAKERQTHEAKLSLIKQLSEDLAKASDTPLDLSHQPLALKLLAEARSATEYQISNLTYQLQSPKIIGYTPGPIEIKNLEVALKNEENKRNRLGQAILQVNSENPKKLTAEARTDLAELVAKKVPVIERQVGFFRDQHEQASKIASELRDKVTTDNKMVEALEARALTDKRKVLEELRTRFEPLARQLKSKHQDCGLTVGEVHALYGYTRVDYHLLNRALYRAEDLVKFKSQIELIKSALAKFKPYPGLVRRGVTLPEDVAAQHQPGNVVDYKSFSSTSIARGFGGRHKLSIHSKRGRYIAPYSAHYAESEVLFAPTKFKVISRQDLPDGTVNIVLEEVE